MRPSVAKTYVEPRQNGAVNTHYANEKSVRRTSGTFVFYQGTDREHNGFARQLTSERQVQKPGPKGQPVIVWENTTQRQNHYFDCAYMACAAAHMAGVRLLDDDAKKHRKPRSRKPMTLAEYHASKGVHG